MPNTDNFFKYLLTIGVLFVLFAVVYPLKKEQALKIEAIELQRKNDELSSDINSLTAQTNELESISRSTQRVLDRLDSIQNRSTGKDYMDVLKQRMDIKEKFDAKKAGIMAYAHDLEVKNILLKYEGRKQLEIERQIWEYAVFKAIFWILGVVFGISGIVFWMGSTYLDEFVKGGNDLGTGYQTYYVHFIRFCRERKLLAAIAMAVAVFACYLVFALCTKR